MVAGPSPTEDRPDEQLVQQVLVGARNRYAFLVQRHQDALFRYARLLTGDAVTAGELCQEAFVHAYGTLKRCKPRSRFRFFVFRTLRELYGDRIHAAPPDTDTATDDPSRSLVDALPFLPGLEREAFFLFHVEDWTWHDIAELTNATLDDVEARVHTARKRIERLLDR